jgi:hypothetical protein
VGWAISSQVVFLEQNKAITKATGCDATGSGSVECAQKTTTMTNDDNDGEGEGEGEGDGEEYI